MLERNLFLLEMAVTNALLLKYMYITYIYYLDIINL